MRPLLLLLGALVACALVACARPAPPSPPRPAGAIACPAPLVPRVRDSAAGRVAWCETTAGQRRGPHERRFANGKLAERGAYADDARDGDWQGWLPDGRVWYTGSYRSGRQHGRWIEHDVDGSTLFAGTYRDGVVHGAWRVLRPDGTEKASGTNRAGRLEGLLIFHTRDGVTRMERNFRDNRPHGRWATYVRDVLVWEGTYRDGFLHGTVTEYETTGAVKKVTEYRDGAEVTP